MSAAQLAQPICKAILWLGVFSFQERPDKIEFLLSSHKPLSVYSLKSEQKRLRLKPWLCDKTSLPVKVVPGASASLLGRAGVLNASGLFMGFWKPLAFRGAGLTQFEGNKSLTE